MDLTAASAGQAIADVPVGTMIANLGLGVAEAQQALDRNSIETATAMMSERLRIRGVDKSLLELGFTPSFYHFTEATLDVNVSVTMRVAEMSTFGLGIGIGAGVPIGSQDSGTAKPGTTPPGPGAPGGSAKPPPAKEEPAEGGSGGADAAAASAARTQAQTSRCVAITADGKQCSRNAATGSDKCTQHSKLAAA